MRGIIVTGILLHLLFQPMEQKNHLKHIMRG